MRSFFMYDHLLQKNDGRIGSGCERLRRVQSLGGRMRAHHRRLSLRERASPMPCARSTSSRRANAPDHGEWGVRAEMAENDASPA
jgi:hypothetical protein